MRGRATYLPVDPRRVPELRRILLRDSAAMAGFWRGAFEEKGADRALIEVAARLFEESTARLDKTPERDALAFFETFDFAAPLPRAAEGLVAFALKDVRKTPVRIEARTALEINARVGVGEAAVDDKASFETTDPFLIQQGRIAVVASVDPATDKIEMAPKWVTALEPDPEPRLVYQPQTASPGDSDVIAITPPVGLAAGDILRVEMVSEAPKFLEVVEIAEDGRCKLAAPIGGAGVSRNTVRQITRQTAFDVSAMPDLQEHGFYIGDKDMLNVEEPADITLRFDRPAVGAALISAGVLFQIYGTREDDPAGAADEPVPRWHDLVPLARPGDDIVLRKAWKGAVDELKLSEDQEEGARYIRIVPGDRLVSEDEGSLIAETRDFRELTLGVDTKLPDGPSDDTISQIAHNGAPLSIASPFNPFGAEPQRFDIFSLAAPEAFTKSGATARLKFEMLDATVLSMKASPRDDVRHVFGLSSNGRLQVADLSGVAPVARQIESPSGGDTNVGERFDPAGAFDVMTLDYQTGSPVSRDVVAVTTQDGRMYVGAIQFNRNPGPTDEPIMLDGEWHQLPEIEAAGLGAFPDGTPERPGLALLPRQIMPNLVQSELIAETSLKFYALQIDLGGVPSASGWTTAFSKPPGYAALLSPSVARVDDTGFPNSSNDTSHWTRRAVLTRDRAGAIWRMGRNGGAYDMHLVSAAGGDSAAMAGLFHDNGTDLAVTQARGGNLRLLRADASDFSTAAVEIDGPAIPASDGPETARLSLAANTNDNQPPRVYAYTQGGVTGKLHGWNPEAGTSEIIDITEGQTVGSGQPGLPVFAALRRPVGSAVDLPNLMIGGTSQKLHRYAPQAADVTVQADWVRIPNAPNDLSDFARAVRRTNEVSGTVEVLNVGHPDFDHVGYVGTDAIYGIAKETDWTEPLETFSAPKSAERPGEIDDMDALTPGDGYAHGLAVGDFVFLSSDGNAPYELFAVSATGAASATLEAASPMTPAEFSDALDDIGRGAPIRWRKAEVNELLPAHAPEFHETLLKVMEPDITGFGQVIDAANVAHDLIIPEPRGVVLPGLVWAIVDAWSDVPPPAFTSLPVLARAGQAISVAPVEIAAGYATPQLSWEYFNGQGWKRLVEGFRDETSNFAVSGQVTFKVPDDLSMAEIGGQEDFWIRARLVGGDYGHPKYIVTTNGNKQTITVDTSHMRPPEVARLSAAFAMPPEHRPGSLIARNNRNDVDVTGANGVSGAQLTAFQGVFQAPLTPNPEDLQMQPGLTVLIGLTEPLATGPVSLLVKVIEGAPAGAVRISVLGSDNRWTKAPLTGSDQTRGLMLSGLLEFQLPVEPARMRLLGKSLHWLRLDLAPGAEMPRIEGLWLNGVAVKQSTTIRQELVGSILGEPDESFALLNTPVLPDTIELRLREDLSDEQIAALREAEGETAVLTNVRNIPGTWVRWTRVDSLAGQPADARVYLADASGNLQFGNGESGLMPTAGANKIRAFAYGQGGMRVETEGFAPAKATSSVEALDKVLAPVAISGGRDLPGDAELVERIPEVLRHAGQGLSLSDIEAMARDIDNEIVQVRAFAPVGRGGKIRIAVLARGKSRSPVYSRASRMALERALGERMSDAFGPECLDVISTPIIPHRVDVALIALPEKSAELDAAASEALRIFLHPSIGGPEGRGWPPGRPLRETDIRRALMNLPGLDRIGDISIHRIDEFLDAPIGPTEVIGVVETRDMRFIVTEDAP